MELETAQRRADFARPLWAMLAALISIFALSFAFRTAVAVAAGSLAVEFDVSARELAAVAAAFHVAFALAQPAVGIALNRYGPRLTVIMAFVLSVIGSLVFATADRLGTLVVGQALIGVGCSPALLAAMVFINRHYPADRFAAISGIVMAFGGIGMLMTGTPLAWVVQTWGWRAGFVALAIIAAMSWLAVFFCVEAEAARPPTNQTPGAALRGYGLILSQPYTAGILCLAATSYAAFLALRGLWLGPLLTQRYGLSLVEVGNVASAISLAGLLGPLVFGRIDPGGAQRRAVIIGCSAGYVAMFTMLAVGSGMAVDITLVIITGVFGGYIVLQYADVRSAYPAELTGRALSMFTMAMFVGVAVIQWLSGVAATLAAGYGVDPLRAALLAIGAWLALGTLAFWRLPWPSR